MRTIDADALFDALGKLKPRNKEHYKSIGEFMHMITDSPTIDAPPHEILNDGTLMVTVEDAAKIGRILVGDGRHFGGLYYPDNGDSDNWIPLRYKLPDTADHVLVTAKWAEGDYEVFELDLGVTEHEAKHGDERSMNLLKHLTAWRHMPDPYMEAELLDKKG